MSFLCCKHVTWHHSGALIGALRMGMCVFGRVFRSLTRHSCCHVTVTCRSVILPGGVEMTASVPYSLTSSTHSGSHTYLHGSSMV